MTAPFPRVEVPGVDPEARDLVQGLVRRAKEVEASVQRNREGMVRAMLAKGYRPYLGHVFRKPKPTRHQRMKARLAARSTKGAEA